MIASHNQGLVEQVDDGWEPFLDRMRDSESKRTEAPDPRAPIRQAFDVSEVIIEVRVGTPATTYNIRRNILCKSSESLRARQKAEWDTGDAAVDLQHDDPAAFGLYANWLYTGTLPSRAPISSADVVHEAEFVLVATAYVLGESVMDVTFQDNVIDPIRAKIRGPKGSVVWHVAREMVHILYEGTPADSQARSFMLELFTKHSTRSILRASHWNYPRDFLNELLDGLIDRPVKAPLTEFGVLAIDCEYHSHLGSESCYLGG